MNKPVLKCQTETIVKVQYHDMDTFIKKVTGHEYEVVAGEEWGNDSEHRFVVSGELDAYTMQQWVAFRDNGEGHTRRLRAILNGMCSEGWLIPGVYLISVSW